MYTQQNVSSSRLLGNGVWKFLILCGNKSVLEMFWGRKKKSSSKTSLQGLFNQVRHEPPRAFHDRTGAGVCLAFSPQSVGPVRSAVGRYPSAPSFSADVDGSEGIGTGGPGGGWSVSADLSGLQSPPLKAERYDCSSDEACTLSCRALTAICLLHAVQTRDSVFRS